jgi:hypothetical protein
MAKLSDIQILLLTTAATREDGSLLPPSDLLGELSARVRKAIESLLRRGLVEEMPVTASEQVWRIEGEQQAHAPPALECSQPESTTSA